MTGAERGAATLPTLVVTQYETLRRAALGELLPPEARSGLTVFLRRGLWGWVRTMPIASASPPLTRSPASSWTAPARDKTVIQVLAAMAIPVDTREARG